MRSLGDNLVDKYGASYKISNRMIPSFLLSVVGLFDVQAKSFSKKVGKKSFWDNTNTNEILGVQHTNFKKSCEDMAESMIN